MPDIRTITPDELDEYVQLDAYAFGYGDVFDAVLAHYRAHYRTEWLLAAFEGGRMVAHLAAIPWRLMLNEGELPFGAIADVAVWPEERRAGHTGALLRACLGRMRDQGLPISLLYPTFYALYRRFGWAQAAETRSYRARAVDLQFLPAATEEAGRVEAVTTEQVDDLAAVYKRLLPRANGLVARDAGHWLFRVFFSQSGRPRRMLVWRDASGQAQGYLIHRYPRRAASGGEGSGGVGAYDQEVVVRELAALTPGAYRGLLTYLARHDLAGRVTWQAAPTDDPLRTLLIDPSLVHVETRPSFMLRVVDLVRALEERAYLACPPARLVLRVADVTAPWNDGAWQLEVEAGRARVTPASTEPHLSLDIATLATLFNGFLSPARAAHAGLLAVHDLDALAVAGQVFAANAPPYCMDYF